MKFKITKDFKFAHRGVEVKEYTAGGEIETEDADLVSVATREGWVEPLDDEAKAAVKAAKTRKPA